MESVGNNNKFFFDLQSKLNAHLNSDNQNRALDYTYETDISSSKESKKLKIALHMEPISSASPNDRLVTLRSLTNPSVAVNFNAISHKRATFTLDDKLFTALDSIFKLALKDFNSIDTYSRPQEGDINVSLGDYEDVSIFQYINNRSGVLESQPTSIQGLNPSKAPTKEAA
jgi:hypothetical protein